MRVRITSIDYKVEGSGGDEKPVVQLAGRAEDGSRVTKHVIGCDPYLYIPETETIPQQYSDRVTDVKNGYESYNGVRLEKVFVKIPKDVEEIRECIGSGYEADLPFYRRVSIDFGLSGYVEIPESGKEIGIGEIETDIDSALIEPIPPRLLVADIEVINPDGISFDEMRDQHSQPITHITAWDSQEDEYVCLYLDREGSVDGQRIKSLLESESSSVSGFDEVQRDITLRRYESEQSLLNGFVVLVGNRRPDIVSGWNFVSFDWDYILGRMSELDGVNKHSLSDIGWASGFQTERKIDCLPAFDMLRGYKKMTVPVEGEKRSYSLDYVSKDDIGIGKLPNVNVNNAYRNDRSRMTAYNIMDVMLCVAIERDQRMHEFFLEVAEFCQIQIFDTVSEMREVDGYIMSRSDDDEILPTADDKDVPENAGGLVLSPSSGVADWVSVFDLKSLYPSCMITWNLSPETIHWYDEEQPEHDNIINVPWLPDADHADGGRFGMADIEFDKMWVDLDEEGLIPKYLKRLFPEREKRKEQRNEYDPGTAEYEMWDRRQAAVKVIMNAFYGVCSMDYWRLATEGLGDSITSSARYALWAGKDIIEKDGYNIKYGDTDSVFVGIDEEDEKNWVIDESIVIEHRLNGRIGEYVSECGVEGSHPILTGDLHGTEQHTLVYEFEKLYRRFFQPGSKKRYAGNVVMEDRKEVDGKIDITGFESQRSDSPEITSEVQPEIINRILEGQDFRSVSGYLQGIIDGIENRKMDSYRFALPKSLGQALDEYGNIPAARACRFSNEYLGKEWEQGNDPWVYYVSETPPMEPDTDVIALGWDEELPEGYELDLDKTLERALENPLNDIVEEVGWSFKELRTGNRNQSAGSVSSDWGEYEQTNESGGEFGW